MQRTFWVNVFCEFRYILDQYRIAVDKVLADRVKVTDKSIAVANCMFQYRMEQQHNNYSQIRMMPSILLQVTSYLHC